MDRRKFIRTVIVGGAGIAATGLPVERVYTQSPGDRATVRTSRRHIGRVIMTRSDQESFARAYAAGLDNAEKAREWLA